MLRHTIHEEAVVERSPDTLDELRKFSREVLERSKLDAYNRGLVLLAIDEILTAIVEDARRSNDSEKMILTFDMNEVRVRVIIEDSQTEFGNDLDEESFQMLSKDASRREIDVQFIISVFDEVTYKFQKGIENRLILTKFIEDA